jgi:hypothetical protein
MPVMPNVTIFMVTSNHEMSNAFSANIAAVMNVKTVSLAVHGTKGVRNMVSNLALFDSTILAPSTEGTLHPNPRHIGKKLLP